LITVANLKDSPIGEIWKLNLKKQGNTRAPYPFLRRCATKGNFLPHSHITVSNEVVTGIKRYISKFGVNLPLKANMEGML